MGKENQAAFRILKGDKPLAKDTGSSSVVQRANGQILFLGRWLINVSVLALFDALALATSLILAGGFRYWLKGEPMFPDWSWFLLLAWYLGAVAVRLLPGWGLSSSEALRRTTLLLIGVFTATTTALFLAKVSTEISRLTLTLSFIASFFLIPIFRVYAKKILIRMNFWGVPTVIWGNRNTAQILIDSLDTEKGLGYVPSAIIDQDSTNKEPVRDIPVFSTLRDLSWSAPIAILAQPDLSRHDTLTLLEGPLAQFRHVVIIPDLYEAPSLWVNPRDMGGILGLEISHNLQDLWSRASKRILDIVLILGTLPLWLPFMSLISALIYLSDFHNPFFIQERLGRKGKLFRMWKFRTMHKNAEARLEKKLEENPALKLEWHNNFKLRRDPRITLIGKFLRISSLDELPQLFHVLSGKMSLVGPRPLPEYHHNKLPSRTQAMRENVRPGMTGLWQISGRSETGNEGIIKWDSYYVRNWSLWLDLVILFRTLRVVISGKGAF